MFVGHEAFPRAASVQLLDLSPEVNFVNLSHVSGYLEIELWSVGRRKKCDKGRPVCDRCHKEGHKCLGYGHIPSSDVSYGVNQSVGSPASSCISDVAGGSSSEALNKFRKKVGT